jgi:hypothetical protein
VLTPEDWRKTPAAIRLGSLLAVLALTGYRMATKSGLYGLLAAWQAAALGGSYYPAPTFVLTAVALWLPVALLAKALRALGVFDRKKRP